MPTVETARRSFAEKRPTCAFLRWRGRSVRWLTGPMRIGSAFLRKATGPSWCRPSRRHDGRLRRNDLPLHFSAGVAGRVRWLTGPMRIGRAFLRKATGLVLVPTVETLPRRDGRLRRNDLPLHFSAGVAGRVRWLTGPMRIGRAFLRKATGCPENMRLPRVFNLCYARFIGMVERIDDHLGLGCLGSLCAGLGLRLRRGLGRWLRDVWVQDDLRCDTCSPWLDCTAGKRAAPVRTEVSLAVIDRWVQAQNRVAPARIPVHTMNRCNRRRVHYRSRWASRCRLGSHAAYRS